MVSAASLIWRNVSVAHRTKAAAGTRATRAVMTAASMIAVPVPSGCKSQMAAYGAFWYNVMETALCNPGHRIGASPSAKTLIVVQIVTVSDTMTHGWQARHSETFGARLMEVSRSASANRGSGIGCHHRNSTSVITVETIEERTSVRG